MTDLYLIAHKVRGEPAFDVATRMECPECDGVGRIRDKRECLCTECDQLGFWWIIPTSGHRAYPYDYKECEWDELSVSEMPPGLPDHYPHSAEPAKPSLLSLIPKPVEAPIRRRV